MKYFCLALAAVLALACSTKKEPMALGAYSEQYRPQIHFSPAKNWTNDPNGLVYHAGEYHLFFQYNPYGDTWGHMSWGHAVSKNLIHWEELPVAIQEYPDATTGDSTMIFSGTVVIDKNNSAGFGANALVALYTSHVHQNNRAQVQHQSIAYSTDKGRTWTSYSKNPVLDIQRKDFRDPKVFWYEPGQKWVMVLVVPDLYKVQLYSSVNLKEWTLMSEFGNAGDRRRIWECPDLYQLPVENQQGKTKWVLSLSGSHPSGDAFVGMQYFTGDFDGHRFTTPDSAARYMDFGKDYYAGIVFNHLDKKIMFGWVNNWTYGTQIPTSPWRGAFSLPRELSLKEDAGSFELVQRPIDLATIRDDTRIDFKNVNGPVELRVDLNAANSGIKLVSASGDEVTIGVDTARRLLIDRTKAGRVDFQKQFASIETSKPLAQLPAHLHIFIDHSIIEVFANDGEVAMCEQFFFRSTQFAIEPFGKAELKIGWRLKSIWR